MILIHTRLKAEDHLMIDRYTKAILTFLAIGVWALAGAIFFQPTPLQAFGDESDINIARIGGTSIYGAIPIEIHGSVTIDFEDEPVFVLEE